MQRAHSAYIIDPAKRRRVDKKKFKKARVLDPYFLEIDPRFRQLSLEKQMKIRRKLKHLNALEIYGANEPKVITPTKQK